jgi:glycosyltransferase involved in cell wall biosynthesis
VDEGPGPQTMDAAPRSPTGRPRVAWVLDRVGPGGDFGHVLDVLRFGLAARAQVHLVALEIEGESALRVQQAGAAVHALELPREEDRRRFRDSALGLVRLFLLLRRLAPRLVLALGEQATVLAAPAARMARVRHLVTVHRRPPAAAGLRALVQGLQGGLSDLVLATSELLGLRTRMALGVHPARIRLVPEGIDLGAILRPLSPRQDPASPRLVAMLRLVEGRDLASLFDAVAMLLRFHERLRLDILGAGPAGLHHLRALQRRGLEHAIRLRGETRDAVDVLAAADLFIHPGGPAGPSRALLEALALGIPVVAAPDPLLADAFPSSSGVHFAAAGRASALADAIDRLLLDPGARAARAAQGRDFVRRHHRAAHLAEAYLGTLDPLLA